MDLKKKVRKERIENISKKNIKKSTENDLWKEEETSKNVSLMTNLYHCILVAHAANGKVFIFLTIMLNEWH